MPPDRDNSDNDGKARASGQGEVYFEFHQVGRAMKVSAVDAATGIEVVVMGPASATQSDLQNIALRKLKARIEREQG